MDSHALDDSRETQRSDPQPKYAAELKRKKDTYRRKLRVQLINQWVMNLLLEGIKEPRYEWHEDVDIEDAPFVYNRNYYDAEDRLRKQLEMDSTSRIRRASLFDEEGLLLREIHRGVNPSEPKIGALKYINNGERYLKQERYSFDLNLLDEKVEQIIMRIDEQTFMNMK